MTKFANNKSFPAFTLIEVLIALIIVAFLATASLIVFAKVRRQTRDSARVSDVLQIQAALAAYHRDFGVYPSIITGGMSLVGSPTLYMETVPTYQTPVDAPCASDSSYLYSSPANYTSYTIQFCISSPVSNLPAGISTATASGIR